MPRAKGDLACSPGLCTDGYDVRPGVLTVHRVGRTDEIVVLAGFAECRRMTLPYFAEVAEAMENVRTGADRDRIGELRAACQTEAGSSSTS